MTCLDPSIAKTKFYKYAAAVISGRIVACLLVKKACERFMRDLEDERFELRLDKIAHCVGFIKMLKHFSGSANNHPFIL